MWLKETTKTMQTFLPYPDFQKSAACLDNKRLGKQRVECLQILKALSDPSYGWQKHPAVRMWINHSTALGMYATEICGEWTRRGFRDTCLEKINATICILPNNLHLPSWLGNETFHASHRSNLLRKDFAHYSQFGWREPSNLPYVWPV